MEKLTALLIVLGVIAFIGIIFYLIYRYFLTNELDRKLLTLKKQVEIAGPENKEALEKKIQDISAESFRFNRDQTLVYTGILASFMLKFWSKEKLQACYDPDQCFGRLCNECKK